MNIAAVQIITSFVVGGLAILLLSLLAEKMHAGIAGIILMFPTTAALGFFFLGWATSPQAVSNIVPATLIPLGMVVLSSFIYISFANYFAGKTQKKLHAIQLSFFSTSLVWFLVVWPFAWSEFRGFKTGILGYLLFTLLTHYFFSRVDFAAKPEKKSYSNKALILRALFSGTVICMVVVTGKLINPFWAGIVTMYPAVTIASLLVLHYNYEPAQLYHFFVKAPIGSLSIFAYCIAVMYAYPAFGLAIGTLIAYAVSLIVSFSLLYFSPKKSKRVAQ